MDKKKIRVVILGFGKMGKIRYRVLSKLAEIDVVAVYDTDDSVEARTEVSDGLDVMVLRGYEDVLSHHPDAVFICTYVSEIAPATCFFLSRGIHVFSEKPPATSLEALHQVGDVIKELNNKHIILKYGFNHRYHYSVMRAYELIKNKDWGRLLWVRGVYGKAGSIDFNKNWRNYKKFSGGGILIDQGIHLLDLIQHLSGGKIRITGKRVATSYWDIETEDNVMLMFDIEPSKSVDSGSYPLGFMHSSATHWYHKFSLELCFCGGGLELNGILSETGSYAPETIRWYERLNNEEFGALGKPETRFQEFTSDDSWALEIDEFFESIKSRRVVSQGSFDDALGLMRLISEIYDVLN